MIKVTIGMVNYDGPASRMNFKGSVAFTNLPADHNDLVRLKALYPDTKFEGCREEDVPEDMKPKPVEGIPLVAVASAPVAPKVESLDDDDLPEVEAQKKSTDDDDEDFKSLPEVEVNPKTARRMEEMAKAAAPAPH